ncbi:MAG: DNRLRE domain-containing protein [Phycisphaeraceae bacterium]|nr:DNRLRE domain-containing protein [Phycisphaeraceae bacterium]
MRIGYTYGRMSLITAAMAAVLFPAAVRAAIIPVTADAEIMTSSSNIYNSNTASNNNTGAQVDMYIGYAGYNKPFKGLLRFDLSSIPANMTITSATLHMKPIGNSNSPTLELHRLLVSWVEGNGLYNQSPYGTSGATYLSRDKSGSNTWTTPGAASDGNDRVAAASVSFNGSLSDPALNVLSDVSYWYANPSANFGWVLETPGTSGFTQFRTKENPSSPTTYLDVTYELIPEPASAGLLLLGGMVLMRRKTA